MSQARYALRREISQARYALRREISQARYALKHDILENRYARSSREKKTCQIVGLFRGKCPKTIKSETL
jgi:hypothetical protein